MFVTLAGTRQRRLTLLLLAQETCRVDLCRADLALSGSALLLLKVRELLEEDVGKRGLVHTQARSLLVLASQACMHLKLGVLAGLPAAEVWVAWLLLCPAQLLCSL